MIFYLNKTVQVSNKTKYYSLVVFYVFKKERRGNIVVVIIYIISFSILVQLNYKTIELWGFLPRNEIIRILLTIQ